MTSRILTIAIISMVCTVFPETNSNGVPQGTASMSITPNQVTAGTYHRVQFVLTVGDLGIREGGGIRIELPVSYLETAPYYWDAPQTTLPDGRGFVKATSSRNVPLDVQIYGARKGIIECIVTGKRIKAKEKITLEYAGVVQSLTWPLRIPVQWHATENDPWQNLPESVELTIKPQPAATMTLVLPTDIVRGESAHLAVAMLDKFGNPASDYIGTVTFTSTDAKAQIPEKYTFTAQDSGVHVFDGINFASLGYQRVDVTDGKLIGNTHYSEIFEKAPTYRRYFGETHFHTGNGADKFHFTARGVGGDHRGQFTSQDQAYRYIRDVIRLDFASASEHDSKVFDDPMWEKSKAIGESFNDPGYFTTFFAYEWTAESREGHHVILYKNRNSKLLKHIEYPLMEDLWSAFDDQGDPAIMIPHPMWAQEDHGIFDKINNKYRKLGEIYSLWNSRYLLQPGVDEDRFELGINNPWTFQYAWSRGNKMGVIGSSDNHTGRPGANNYTSFTEHSGGLAVALAKDNTRENLWDAFDYRRTYATSGTRILLTFTADSNPMGAEYKSKRAPVFNVSVAGTRYLEKVDIVKYSSKGYEVIYSTDPEGDITMFEYTDKNFTEDSMYYLRVKQVNETWTSPWAYGNREMAWSSPIWIEKIKLK